MTVKKIKLMCTDGKIYKPHQKARKKSNGIIVRIDFIKFVALSDAIINMTYKNNPTQFETAKADYDRASMLTLNDLKFVDEFIKAFTNKQLEIIISTAKKYKTWFFTLNNNMSIYVVFDEFNKNSVDRFISNIISSLKKDTKRQLSKEFCASSPASITKLVAGYEKYETKRMKQARVKQFARIFNAMCAEKEIGKK